MHRALGIVGRVFQYAISTGRVERNLAADLRGALAPVSRGHYASITEPKEVGSLLRAIDGYRGSFAVQCALKLAALTFVRPGELRLAEWYEIVFDAAEWRIPAARMKMKAPHIVPLSRQALVILGELHSLPGVGRYVFPSAGAQLAGLPARSISENTVNAALRSMGYTKGKMTGHGFRAMARTILDEVLGVRPDIIEHQLAHMVRDPLGRAYNRTTHLPERRIMMQRWADYLDTMIKGTHS